MRTEIKSNPLAPTGYAHNTESLACSLRAAIGKGWINPASEHEATRLYHALNAFLESVGEDRHGHAEHADQRSIRAHTGT